MLAFFDLDGTLVDMTERWYQLHVTLSRKHELPVLEKDEYISNKRDGVSERNIFGCIPQSQTAAVEAYCAERLVLIEEEKYLKYDQLIPEAPAILNAWKNHYDLVLVTKRQHPDALKRQLHSLKLSEFFIKVIVGTSKAMEIKNSFSKTELYRAPFITDALEDYQFAQMLEMYPIVVGYGTRSPAYFKKNGVESVVDNPSYLIEISNKDF